MCMPLSTIWRHELSRRSKNIPVIDEVVNEKNVIAAINYSYPFETYKLIDFTFSHKVTGKCVMSAYELYSRSFQIDE